MDSFERFSCSSVALDKFHGFTTRFSSSMESCSSLMGSQFPESYLLNSLLLYLSMEGSPSEHSFSASLTMPNGTFQLILRHFSLNISSSCCFDEASSPNIFSP